MRKIKKITAGEEGNVLVFTIFSMICMIGFAALSIDMGTIMSARNQLQSAADAAALSGAAGLMTNNNESKIKAIATASHNTCLNQPVIIGVSDVTFPQANQVMIQAHQAVSLNFTSLLGINTANISTIAVAELNTIIGTTELRPWAIPDMNYKPGDKVSIKVGVLEDPDGGSDLFYPVDFPPINRGGSVASCGPCEYKRNIINGTSHYISVNDILQVNPENLIMMTKRGVNALIYKDPGAYWDPGYGVNGGVVHSSAGPDGSSSSPRVVIVPLYNRDEVPSSDWNTLTVTRLGAFFVTAFHGGKLKGVFMQSWHQGTSGGGNSMVKSVKLVQ